MSSSISKDTTITCDYGKFYQFFKEKSSDISKASDVVQNIEHVPPATEWVNVKGTRKRLHFYIDGIRQPQMIGDEVKDIDDSLMTTIFTVKEGEILQSYKNIEFTFAVNANQAVTWTIKFDKISPDLPDPHKYLDLLGKVTKDVSDYINAHS